MRPPGDIRQALASTAAAIVPTQGPASWRDLAVASGVGYTAARQTVENMARAGDLAVLGTQRRPHSRRPVNVYAPADRTTRPAAAADSSAALAGVMQVWVQL